MSVSDAALFRRTGTTERPAPSRTLRAGRLEATLAEGGLRTIRFDGHEVLRAIAYVVRDRDWGTYAPVLRDLDIAENRDGFCVTYRATCVDREDGQRLGYAARIEGSASGSLRFAVSATPETDFVTARCGFAVLHPLRGVVGQPARIEHGDGRVRDASFPDLIEPWQPFQDIRAITHFPVPDLEACCRLEGDVFEMEDQRAWSDASFKTYVRPLALPWPYLLPAGSPNRQSVTLDVVDRRGRSAAAGTEADKPVRLRLGTIVGEMPPIGLVFHPEQIATALAHPDLLRAIAPQRLLFHHDPLAGHDRDTLRGFAAVAALLDETEIGLEVAVPAAAPLDEEMQALASDITAAELRLDTLMVSPSVDRQSTPPGSTWPPCPPLADLYEAARRVFPDVRLGGGMLSYFTELNRKRPPVEMLDFVSHCTCPIVHAADDLSVMQSLEALPDILRSARAIIGSDRPYRLGPSTIGMRQNPYGSRVIPNPDGVRMTMTDCDPRQRGLFAAAWTIGYVTATATAELDGLVPGALSGSLGLIGLDREGGIQRYPVFFVVQALAMLAGRPRRACLTSEPGRVAAVAADDADGTTLWIANLSAVDQDIVLEQASRCEILLHLGDDDRGGATGLVELRDGQFQLSPYAVIGLRLD